VAGAINFRGNLHPSTPGTLGGGAAPGWYMVTREAAPLRAPATSAQRTPPAKDWGGRKD